MHIPWDDIQLFLAVAEGGSLSAAARKLGVGQPTVSRRIAALEAQLSERLFERSADGTTLTAAAEQLLAPARRMAESAGELMRVAERGDAAPQGVVRLTAPPGIAFDFVAPFAASLRSRLPAVRLEVRSSIQYLDLSRREADPALRMRPAEERDLVTVATLEHDSAAFASAAYRSQLPKGYGISDIDWIAWAPPFESLSPNPELAALIPNFRPAFASDDFLVQLAAAAAGVGAMFLGRVRHPYSVDRGLCELDLDLGGRGKSATHLVCAKSALDIPRVRAVADLIRSDFACTETIAT